MKMIIADDERAVREGIAKLIDWEEVGVALVGLCADGIEAYDMVLDESPDIVLADIEMPGLNGLELVEKVAQAELETRFIILSGYSEFEYAKQAMRYGVKHYLLKPCNEVQILSCIREIKNEIDGQNALREQGKWQSNAMSIFRVNVLYTALSEGISRHGISVKDLEVYDQFMTIRPTDYKLLTLWSPSQDQLVSTYEQMHHHAHTSAKTAAVYGVMVKDTLLVFFEDTAENNRDLITYLDTDLKARGVSQTQPSRRYPSMSSLLLTIIQKARQYDMIHCLNGSERTAICNYPAILSKALTLTDESMQLEKGNARSKRDELAALLSNVSDIDFLKQIAVSLLIGYTTKIPRPAAVTTDLIQGICGQTDINAVLKMLVAHISELIGLNDSRHRSFVEHILQCIHEHLSNPKLTLKWIAENHLYLNVDYVSRKFVKETGCKFSNYVTELRIEKAKSLLLEHSDQTLQSIAVQVGCGDNYQYFSQIFRKHTGMTPGAFARAAQSEKRNGEANGSNV